MAIDTRNKRASCLGFAGPARSVFPNPDGALGAADRQQISWSYASAAAAAAAAASTYGVPSRELGQPVAAPPTPRVGSGRRPAFAPDLWSLLPVTATCPRPPALTPTLPQARAYAPPLEETPPPPPAPLPAVVARLRGSVASDGAFGLLGCRAGAAATVLAAQLLGSCSLPAFRAEKIAVVLALTSRLRAGGAARGGDLYQKVREAEDLVLFGKQELEDALWLLRGGGK